MKLPLTFVVLTQNEENIIEECLKSIYGIGEDIFIVDSFSSDKTVQIARKYTEKIYNHRFEIYSKQRNWAQRELTIKTDWVFHLDADERVTEELREELIRIFSSPSVNDFDGYFISRKTVFMRKWIRHGGHYPAYHLRLFIKDKGRCEDRLYDQHFIINGKTGILDNDIIDIITSDFSSWNMRLKRWAKLEAQEVVKKNNINGAFVIAGDKNGDFIQRKRWLRERYYALPIFLRPILYFLYRYFFRLGFLDGIQGLVFHFWQGFWYRLQVDIEISRFKKSYA